MPYCDRDRVSEKLISDHRRCAAGHEIAWANKLRILDGRRLLGYDVQANRSRVSAAVTNAGGKCSRNLFALTSSGAWLPGTRRSRRYWLRFLGPLTLCSSSSANTAKKSRCLMKGLQNVLDRFTESNPIRPPRWTAFRPVRPELPGQRTPGWVYQNFQKGQLFSAFPVECRAQRP